MGKRKKGKASKGDKILLEDAADSDPGTNCKKISLPGKLILSKRKGLPGKSYSLENSL